MGRNVCRVLLAVGLFSILLSTRTLFAQEVTPKWEAQGGEGDAPRGGGLISGARPVIERLSVKVGVNIGGAIPTRLIEGMRVDSYPLPFLPQLTVCHHTPLSPALGVEVGLRFEYKGMRPRAWVHDYYTSVNRAQQGKSARVEGHFTGDVLTELGAAYLSLPLRVSYRLGERTSFKLGGYFAYIFSSSFQGTVENGYFWTKPAEEGHPSDKIAIERETYEFSSSLRSWETGVEVLYAYRLTHRFSLEAGLSYALSSLFQGAFTGLSYPMRSSYLSLGVGYHFAKP